MTPIFLIMFTCSISTSIVIFIKYQIILKKGYHTTSNIIGYQEIKDRDRGLPTFKPIVEFQLQTGKTIQETIHLAWGKKYEINELEIVYYHNGKKTTTLIKSFTGIHLIPFILLIFACICLFFGLVANNEKSIPVNPHHSYYYLQSYQLPTKSELHTS